SVSSNRLTSGNPRCVGEFIVDAGRRPATDSSEPHVGLYSGRVISHPDKVLFPDDGITKGELAAYYEAIAPIMLPHISRRPVTMERYPSGIDKKGFWQKD